MNRFLVVLLTALTTAGVLSSCSSHHTESAPSPASLAALHADLRMVRGETTWVTHGRGYELVGRSRADLVTLQPALDRASAFLTQIYPGDTLAHIVAAVRRTPAPGKPYLTAAPVPDDARGAQVELVLVDPKAFEEQRKNANTPPRADDMRMLGGNPIMPAIRAWLSARASHLTGTPANLNQSRGETDDPRVPAFATTMIADAGDDTFIDNATKSLAAHMDALLPLSRYFTMDRPSPAEMTVARRGNSGGDAPSDGRRGGMGGMGGRGGMGGGRGIGGRGGMGGGRSMPGGSSEHTIPLQGPALFAAESAVLSKYFARAGADVVGEIIDARITGKPIDDVLAKHNLGTVQQVEDDWRNWLAERADMLTRR